MLTGSSLHLRDPEDDRTTVLEVDVVSIAFPRFYARTVREPGVTYEIQVLRIDRGPTGVFWSSKAGRSDLGEGTVRNHEMLLVDGWVHISEATAKSFVTEF